MKKLLMVLTLLIAVSHANSQNIIHARFRISADGESFRFMELVFDNGVTVGINDCREIAYIEGGGHYGDINPYDPKMAIKYYDHFDIHDQPGKIKSIGAMVFKYNNAFDIHDKFGTLKSVGNIPIRYYNTFDMHDPKGKVKSVGRVIIRYYNAFDINDRFGDIKSITGNSSNLSVSVSYRRRLGYNEY